MEQNTEEQDVQKAGKRVAGNLSACQSTEKQRRRIWQQRSCKFFAALICIFMVCAFTLSPTSGNLLLIPGFDAQSPDHSRITHSIERPFAMERNGFINRIMGAFIMGNRIHVELIGYEATKGPTYQLQFMKIPTSDFIPYSLYYKGKKCTNHQNGMGNSVTLSYELPRFNKKENVVVALHYGDVFLGDITLIPVAHSTQLNKIRPHSTVQNITLMADIERKENETTIYLFADLPSDALKLQTFSDSLIYNVETEKIFLRDKDGKIYGSTSDGWREEEPSLLRNWRVYSFRIPADIKDFTIVIPEITYVKGTRRNMERVPRTGPWEIQYTSPE